MAPTLPFKKSILPKTLEQGQNCNKYHFINAFIFSILYQNSGYRKCYSNFY